MARRDASLRLRETLLARRADLSKLLAVELANLRDFRAAESTTDSADVAFEASSDELSSLLAELDARDLGQVERVLARLARGSYGVCAGCQKRIPLARLNALPCTAFCINCERELEKHRRQRARPGADNWKRVPDPEAPAERQRVLHTVER